MCLCLALFSGCWDYVDSFLSSSVECELLSTLVRARQTLEYLNVSTFLDPGSLPNNPESAAPDDSWVGSDHPNSHSRLTDLR